MGFFEGMSVAQARVSAWLNHMQGMQKLARTVLDAGDQKAGELHEFEAKAADKLSCPLQHRVPLTELSVCDVLPPQDSAVHYPLASVFSGKTACSLTTVEPHSSGMCQSFKRGSVNLPETSKSCLREDGETALCLISRHTDRPRPAEKRNCCHHAAGYEGVSVRQSLPVCTAQTQGALIHAVRSCGRETGSLPRTIGSSKRNTYSSDTLIVIHEGTRSPVTAEAVPTSRRTQAGSSREVQMPKHPPNTAQASPPSVEEKALAFAKTSAGVQASLRTYPHFVPDSPSAREITGSIKRREAERNVNNAEEPDPWQARCSVDKREPGKLLADSSSYTRGGRKCRAVSAEPDSDGSRDRRRSFKDGTRDLKVPLLTAWQFFKELHELVRETGDLRDYICETYGVARVHKYSQSVLKQQRGETVPVSVCDGVDCSLSDDSLSTITKSSLRSMTSHVSSSLSISALQAATRGVTANVSSSFCQLRLPTMESRNVKQTNLRQSARREQRDLLDMLQTHILSQIYESEIHDAQDIFEASPSSNGFSDSLSFLEDVVDVLMHYPSDEEA
uniref:Uncharacterized protein n=1 Tax=Toxoplasma gondii COUG TaxID=1074873 RepID=A0A2G8XYG0_TOXGO|nr:hypothetical protein TGCOUG_213290 [Toxoplasma gondii COUG]